MSRVGPGTPLGPLGDQSQIFHDFSWILECLWKSFWEQIFEDFPEKSSEATILERFWDVSLQDRFFHRIFIVLELVWTGKIKQNHCTVIKNQGFAKVSEIRFGVRFFIDFGVTLGGFWQEIEALERFLREKTSFKITSKIGVDFHGF